MLLSATYSIVLGLHLVNRFRTRSRKICVPPRFRGVYVHEVLSPDTLRDNLASARVEIPLALEGDSEFRSLRNSSAIPVGPAQSERCKSLRFPIKFRASNAV